MRLFHIPTRLALLLGCLVLFATACTEKEYTITVSSADGAMGSVYGGGVHAKGVKTEIGARPAEGYRFDHWQDQNTDNPRTITVESDASYTAYFALRGADEQDTSSRPSNSCTIVVRTDNPDQGSVSGGGTFLKGTQVTISATPAEGFRFVRWQDHNTDNPRTFVADTSAEFVAYFAEVSPEPEPDTTTLADRIVGRYDVGYIAVATYTLPILGEQHYTSDTLYDPATIAHGNTADSVVMTFRGTVVPGSVDEQGLHLADMHIEQTVEGIPVNLSVHHPVISIAEEGLLQWTSTAQGSVVYNEVSIPVTGTITFIATRIEEDE
ncbi:MAG: hypothetical protein IJV22_05375 [Bacteroidales bacterium]|nr:hypothetical protein [Bacteroidales bacterium]